MNILLIGYNRPDLLRGQYQRLLEFGIEKKNIYVAIDGPKNETDRYLVETCQADAKKFQIPINNQKFSTKNQGCRLAVINSINWFFENNSEGIILEDDCVPSQEFFRFCEKNIDALKNPFIFSISGSSPLSGTHHNPPGDYLSELPFIWGWCTTAKKWEEVNFETTISVKDFFKAIFHFRSFPISLYFFYFQSKVNKRHIDTWDTDLVWHCVKEKKFCLAPNEPLISNIGARPDATNTVVPNAMIGRALSTSYVAQHHDSSFFSKKSFILVAKKIFPISAVNIVKLFLFFLLKLFRIHA